MKGVNFLSDPYWREKAIQVKVPRRIIQIENCRKQKLTIYYLFATLVTRVSSHSTFYAKTLLVDNSQLFSNQVIFYKRHMCGALFVFFI